MDKYCISRVGLVKSMRVPGGSLNSVRALFGRGSSQWKQIIPTIDVPHVSTRHKVRDRALLSRRPPPAAAKAETKEHRHPATLLKLVFTAAASERLGGSAGANGALYEADLRRLVATQLRDSARAGKMDDYMFRASRPELPQRRREDELSRDLQLLGPFVQPKALSRMASGLLTRSPRARRTRLTTRSRSTL